MESDLLKLFPDEVPEVKEPQPKKKRGAYHGAKGRFTDRTTAEIHELRKQADISNKNYRYYKRLAKRLHAEYEAEHARVLELEQTLKELTQQHETTHVQPQGIFTSTQPPKYGSVSC